MANELDAAFNGVNVLHENRTATRIITLKVGAAAIDLTAYSNFRSDVRANAGNPVTLGTAAIAMIDAANGILSWRLDKAETAAIAATKGGAGNATFKTDIRADFDADPGRVDHLGHGSGEVQPEVTTSG